ncbi:glycoside hydrolase family 3 C-terminal domain-containing protein [Microlunatus ginsengisoli]|uniref:Glycoside hydrolase family 3 C-terminal domain-containing protein n=1 Tax=Microlunatus ginsengisoli TaxID=363863 RepID=A0ABP6ZE61_9ACTN
MTDTSIHAAADADSAGPVRFARPLLTLEEKASLTSGADFWMTQAIDRVSVPGIMLTDGPHGLRKQVAETDHLGLAESVPATCFPPAVGLGSSWDPDLLRRVGEALGIESAVEGVAVLLGPGVNIKRHPLCGRNFEYFSEDPVLAAGLGVGFVTGLQSKGVGASLKHFAANNQESDRLLVSSDVDPRPLREIYLRAFQRVVTETQPWTVMCSYNRINGVHASQDPWLLTHVLRGEWGFQRLVVSDWGAVAQRVPALRAGLDLEMPSSGGRTDAQIVAAINDGTLDEEVLDRAVSRVLDLVAKASARPPMSGPFDVDAHHQLAREAAGRSIVLLKNDDALLPLARSTTLAVIGAFAENPRYQGAGSSHINPTRLDTALAEIRALSQVEVRYAAGFGFDDAESADDLRAEAVAAASACEVAVVMLGLPARSESEGFDRQHIDLPDEQLALLDAVVQANPRTVVVLSNGGVVALPFADQVPTILEGWLLGQAGGGGTADVLYGVVNPSAKLTETIPRRLADTPAYGNFPGEHGHVRYGEGLFVGYRWYDERALDVAFPFGHGLSYTTFAYGEPSVVTRSDGDLEISVPVTNTGSVAGREVVQVYTSLPSSRVQRPPRELKAFASVPIQPGATADATMVIRREDLAYWDVRVDRWIVEGGAYLIEVGASSRDLRVSALIEVAGDRLKLPLTEESRLSDVLDHPIAGPLLRVALTAMRAAFRGPQEQAEAMEMMLASMPIGRMVNFPGASITRELIAKVIAASLPGDT